MAFVLVSPATVGVEPSHSTPFGIGNVTLANVTVKANGKNIVCVGDVVSPHSGTSATPHPPPTTPPTVLTVSTGSSKVFIGGRPVAKVGSIASCGGLVNTTAVPTVNIGA